MLHFFLTLFLSGVVLYVVAALAPGVRCAGLISAMLAVIVFSLAMSLLRPNLLGYTAAQRGLVSLLTAAVSLWLSGLLVPGFTVNGLSGGLAGVLTLGLLQLVLLALL